MTALSFLQSKLPSYTLSYQNNYPILTGKPEEPIFCLLPKCSFFRKPPLLNAVWILPTWRFSKINIPNLQPLYFMAKRPNGSFCLYDQRYLKTTQGLYRLPPVEIDITSFFPKSLELQEKENLFFSLQRTSSFYFKGDTSDRLLHPPYEKALLTRQEMPFKKSLTPLYIFIKKALDK